MVKKIQPATKSRTKSMLNFPQNSGMYLGGLELTKSRLKLDAPPSLQLLQRAYLRGGIEDE